MNGPSTFDQKWCAGWRRAGHPTDLLLQTNAGIQMCQRCVMAWLRDDEREPHDG